jgi:thiamine-phosphate pyrophosphorylase
VTSPLPRPTICLVTDRRRTAPGDSTWAGQERALIALISDAAEAGVDLIQIREPDLDARYLYALTAAAVTATRGSSTRVVVNDRADVALAAGADGVHLTAVGPPVDRVRALGPRGWLIGRSAHSAQEVDAAVSADYIIFGTVFSTVSKPGVEGQGIDALADAVRRVPVPILGIGGMNADRARACKRAGAAGIAAISLFLDHADGGCAPRAAVRMLRNAFNAD